MNPNIERLEALVKELPDLSAVVRESTGTRVDYDVSDGECVGFGLYNVPGIAVQNNCITKGTTFPAHKHNAKEILVVYEGKLRITCAGEVKEIVAGGHYYIPCKTVHIVEALEDTWLIGITIPAGEGYPDA